MGIIAFFFIAIVIYILFQASLLVFIPLLIIILIDGMIFKIIGKLFSKGFGGIFLGLVLSCAVIIPNVKVGKYCINNYKNYWLSVTGFGEHEKTRKELEAEQRHAEKIQNEHADGLYRFKSVVVKKDGTNLERNYKIKKGGRLTQYDPLPFQSKDSNFRSYDYSITNLIYNENETKPCGFELEARYKSKVNIFRFYDSRNVSDPKNLRFVRCNDFDKIIEILNRNNKPFFMKIVK